MASIVQSTAIVRILKIKIERVARLADLKGKRGIADLSRHEESHRRLAT